MPLRPFQNEFADHRVVVIPASLDDEKRARFLAKVAAAVKLQANLAAKCDGVLNVAGEIEQRGDHILIPHEPAAPADPAVIESASELPGIDVIWWLSWSLAQALRAAAPGTVHGGIQMAALYQDEFGRVKLGDFGIAPAFEAICGIEQRRELHCEAAVGPVEGGRRCSGVWSLLSEDDAHDHGWITPYFAHELLQGTQRLNPKADQFAAGTLLYLLATGTHPYGASLSDPTLMLYFHLEPFALRDERSEWEEVFEREATGISLEADKPVLAWAEFVQKLLASESGERFANAAEVEAATADFSPNAWADASAAVTAGLRQLDAGEVEAFLEKVAPWKDAETLPDLWRERMSGRVAEIESRKEEIGARKRVEQRLSEGHKALNNVEVEQAREIAREVLAAPQCDDALRAEAEELIGLCDEQDEFIESGADDLAKVYLESAGECLARHDFDGARQMLVGLLNDPATPSARGAQARQLIVEVELTEQRVEQHRSELAGAGEDLREWRPDAARERLDNLLAEEDVPEPIAAEARALLEEVTKAQAERAARVAALDQARAAWEHADLETLDEHLGTVPPDCADPEIAEGCAALASRRASLETALQRHAAAEQAWAGDDLETAAEQTEQALAATELPKTLHKQLDEFLATCRSTIAERENERVERVSAALKEAEAACDALRVDECRRLLEEGVVKEPGLPEETAKRASELLQTCEWVEKAQQLFEHARQHLADGELEDASALLDALQEEGLPDAVVAELEELRADAAKAREEHEKREQQRLATRLDQVDQRIEEGEFDEAEAALGEAEASPYLSSALRKRTARARSALEKQRPILATIGKAEEALSGEPDDLKTLLAEIERLPADLPGWASARIERIKEGVAQIADRRRREAIAQATAALDATQAAVDAGEVSMARKHLAQAHPALELDPTLAERHEELASRTAALEEWLPKVEAASETVNRGDLLTAHRGVSGLLESESIPELCRNKLLELKDQAERQIAARQQEIDAELAGLATELSERGRRAKKFPQRVNALKGDPLATEEQHAKADGMLGEYEALPELKASKVPLAIAASAVVIVVIAAGIHFGGGGGDEPPGPTAPAGNGGDVVVKSPDQPSREPVVKPERKEPPVVVKDVGERMAAALGRLQTELAEASEWAAAQGRVRADWRLVLEPAGKLPTKLLAVEVASGQRETVGAAGSVAELELLRLTPDLRDALFPEPPAPSIAERIATAVERLQSDIDAARDQAGDRDTPGPRFAVRADPANALPTALIARNEQTEEEIRLGEVSEAGLDELVLTDEWRERLYPPPPSIAARIAAAVERLQAQVDAARRQADLPEAPAPRFIVLIDPPDGLPATVIARNQQTGTETRLGEVAGAELEELALGEAWREQLYPPPPPEPERPSFDEIAKAYLDELREALPSGAANEELLPTEGETFAVNVQWNGRALLPLPGLRLDEGESRFTSSPAAAAAHFRLQVEALEALGEPIRTTIAPAAPGETPYEVSLQLAEPVRDVTIEEVDSEARSVRVKAAARLDGDPRSAATFPFSAVCRDGKLVIDDAAQSAFRSYLGELQQHQLLDSLLPGGIEQGLELPSGVALSWPTDFSGGPRVTLNVKGAEGHTFGALDVHWNPATLLYEINSSEAVAALRAGVHAAAAEEATREALVGEWPEIRPSLAPPAQQPGAEYFGRCGLLNLDVSADQSNEPFVVAVEVTVGPEGAAAEEQIRFPARLAVLDGAWTWDQDATREARATIMARLQGLSQSDDLRASRRQAVLAALAGELGVDHSAVTAEAEGDGLSADVAVDGRQRRFAWTWNDAELRYADRVESAPPTPPALTLGDRLRQLASRPTAETGAFVETLREVAQAKTERYGASNYRLTEAFASATDPAAALVAVSANLQRLVAPDPTRHPFPVVFVEYFVDETDVYALGWRVETADNDAIIGVSSARVWQVMPTAKLRGYSRPSAFRDEYSTDAELGERLLGQAFAETLEGSGGGSFGVIVAPDGPLWLTRWEQVRFNPRAVERVAPRGTESLGQTSTLRELLKPARRGEGDAAWRRAGLWCVPTLAGEWGGPANQIDKFQLGVLVSGKKPSVASYRRRGQAMLAPVIDPTVTRLDAGWVSELQRTRPEELGYKFWDRGWSGERWRPTPLASVSLIQMP